MIRDGQQTLASMLQDQGYTTYFAGKWHLGGGARSPDDRTRLVEGPTDFGFNDSRTLWRGLGADPLLFLDNDRDRPSADAERYAYFSPCLHDMPGAIDFDEPSPDGWSPMANWTDENRWVSTVGPCLASWSTRMIRVAPTPFLLYYSSAAGHAPHLPPVRFLDKGHIRGASGMGNLADMMIETDRALGTLVDALEERSLLDNTIILFTADNGQYAPGGRYTAAVERRPEQIEGEPCDQANPSYCRGTPPCEDEATAAYKASRSAAGLPDEEHSNIKHEACSAPNANRGATSYFRERDGATFDFVHGLRGHKGTAYEGGLRVPLVVRWGSQARGHHIRAGHTSSVLITHVDLVRTLVTLTGGQVPAGQAVDSVDQSALLLGKSDEAKRTSTWHYAGVGQRGIFVARVGDWKWLLGCNSTPDGREPVRDRASRAGLEGPEYLNLPLNATFDCLVAEELYDLHTDPLETTDLVNSPRRNEAAQPWDLAKEILGNVLAGNTLLPDEDYGLG